MKGKSRAYNTGYRDGCSGEKVGCSSEFYQYHKEYWQGVDDGCISGLWYIPVEKNGKNIQVVRHGDFVTICEWLQKEGYISPFTLCNGEMSLFCGERGNGRKEALLVLQ